MSEQGLRRRADWKSADWTAGRHRWPPMAWVILAAGTVLCGIAAFLA